MAAPQWGTITISTRWSRSRVIWFENYSGGWALYTFPLGRSARHLVWKQRSAVLPDEVTVVLVVLSKTSEEFARNNFGRVVMRKNSSEFSRYETRWAYVLLMTLPIRSGRKSINIWLLFPMEILEDFCVDHVSALCTLSPISTSSPKSHKRVLTQRTSHLCLFVGFYKNPLRLEV